MILASPISSDKHDINVLYKILIRPNHDISTFRNTVSKVI